MQLLTRYRKSTAPQNRQLIVYCYQSKGLVDGFVGELTFRNSQVLDLGGARVASGRYLGQFELTNLGSLGTFPLESRQICTANLECQLVYNPRCLRCWTRVASGRSRARPFARVDEFVLRIPSVNL